MRPLLVLALLSSLLGAAASPLRGDWLILVGGKKIATEGPWSLKGDLLTVHETSGRILTVATNTVDAEACRKANAGSLHLKVIPTAPAPGSPVTKPRIDAAAAAGLGPRNPATSPPGPAAGAPRVKTPEERAAAQKLAARQAQLRRDQRHHRIVEGCARMFVVDRAGFDRCVEIQTQAPSPAQPQSPPQRR